MGEQTASELHPSVEKDMSSKLVEQDIFTISESELTKNPKWEKV